MCIFVKDYRFYNRAILKSGLHKRSLHCQILADTRRNNRSSRCRCWASSSNVSGATSPLTTSTPFFYSFFFTDQLCCTPVTRRTRLEKRLWRSPKSILGAREERSNTVGCKFAQQTPQGRLNN